MEKRPFQQHISNEDTAKLPAVLFEGPIVIVDDEKQVEAACRDLASSPVLGFDTETRPSFKAGVTYRVALLQLSTPRRCYLFRLNRMRFEKQLVKLLENKAILKIGADVAGDIRSLLALRRFRPGGFVDLQQLAPDWGIEEKSLRKLSAIVLGKRVSKAQRLSNWEAATVYRKTDALRRHRRMDLPRNTTARCNIPLNRTTNDDPPPYFPAQRQRRVAAAPSPMDLLGRDRPRGVSLRHRSPRGRSSTSIPPPAISSHAATTRSDQSPCGCSPSRRSRSTPAWWRARIRSACEVRRTLGLIGNAATTCYRLVHGEGDSLPGLVIDIYGTAAVVQCHSVGMYLARQDADRARRSARSTASVIAAVYDKSSQTVPFKAGLGAVDGYLMGEARDHPAHGGVGERRSNFLVNWEQGQRTRVSSSTSADNRELVRKRYADGAHGAQHLLLHGGLLGLRRRGRSEGGLLGRRLGASRRSWPTENMRLNFGPQASFPHTTLACDAVEYLKQIGDRYDLIILDPPAFAKHHKVLGNAMQGYKRLNARGVVAVRPGGILFTFSCSQAVTKELFRTTVFSAAAIAGRNVRILHQLTQPADHPINIYHPEGEYLKGLVLYVE